MRKKGDEIVVKRGENKTEKEDVEEFFSGLENLKIAFEANYEYFYDLLESDKSEKNKII